MWWGTSIIEVCLNSDFSNSHFVGFGLKKLKFTAKIHFWVMNVGVGGGTVGGITDFGPFLEKIVFLDGFQIFSVEHTMCRRTSVIENV